MNTIVRKIREQDIGRLATYANNRKIWLNLRDYFPHPYSKEDAADFYKMITDEQNPNKIFAVATSEGLIGIVGIHPLTDIYSKTTELGYWIGEPYWGQGHMTNAVNWMLDYTWEKTEFLRIEAGVFEPNIGSMRVLEKCGFHKESVKRNRLIKDQKIYDEHMFVMLRPE